MDVFLLIAMLGLSLECDRKQFYSSGFPQLGQKLGTSKGSRPLCIREASQWGQRIRA